MHKVKPDQRSRESATAIANALFALVTLKPWQEIGISEVAGLAQVGRATFYRNFDTLEDVISYQLKQASERLQNRLVAASDHKKLNLDGYLAICGNFWLGEHALLKALMATEQGYRLSECLYADLSATDIDVVDTLQTPLHLECLCTMLSKVIFHSFIQQKTEDPEAYLRIVLRDLANYLPQF